MILALLISTAVVATPQFVFRKDTDSATTICNTGRNSVKIRCLAKIVATQKDVIERLRAELETVKKEVVTKANKDDMPTKLVSFGSSVILESQLDSQFCANLESGGDRNIMGGPCDRRDLADATWKIKKR